MQNKALRTGRGLAVRRKSENLPAVRKRISGFHSHRSQATSRCGFRLSGETAGWRPLCSRVQEHSAIFRPDRAFGIVKRLSADGRRYGRFEPPFLLRERRLFLLFRVRLLRERRRKKAKSVKVKVKSCGVFHFLFCSLVFCFGL